MFLENPLRQVFYGQLNLSRHFGVKRVVQKSRYMMRLIKPKQESYVPKPDNYVPVPMSVLGSGPLRKLVQAKTQEAYSLAKQVQWEMYKSTQKGVRWHPSGSWMVSFHQNNYENNFHVACCAKFRVSKFGFSGAKLLATQMRQRLELEWQQLQQAWQHNDREKALAKAQRKKEKEEMTREEY